MNSQLAILLPLLLAIQTLALPESDQSVFMAGDDYGNLIAPPSYQVLSNWSVQILGFGRIYGQVVNTDANVTLTQFLGIPYATPPSGSLRFAKPTPPKTSSSTIHLALKMPPHCMQVGNQSLLIMSEDCLYLNIWTHLHDKSSVNDLPVIVFLHGGFFHSGGTADDRWNGIRMLNHEKLVLVTVNYRVGVFGFLSYGTEAGGNYGLMDQELAINWVNKNIGKLGGSSSKVTLMGVEAGAVSVGYHLTRPQPKFQRAVMLTGSPFMRYPVTDNLSSVQLKNKDFVERVLKCTNSPMQCLRDMDASYINEKQRDFGSIYWGIPLQFPPVINGDFIKSDPIKMNFSQVPQIQLIIGLVDNPGHGFVRSIEGDTNLPEAKLREAVGEIVKYFPRFPTEPSTGQINATVERFGKKLTVMFRSLHYTCAVNRFRDAIASYGHKSVYSFRFTESIRGENASTGADLFDDAQVAFGNVVNRTELSKKIIHSLVTFTETGTPDWPGLNWPEYNTTRRATLLAQENSTLLVGDDFDYEHDRFWNEALLGNDSTTTSTTSTDAFTTGTTRAETGSETTASTLISSASTEKEASSVVTQTTIKDTEATRASFSTGVPTTKLDTDAATKSSSATTNTSPTSIAASSASATITSPGTGTSPVTVTSRGTSTEAVTIKGGLTGSVTATGKTDVPTSTPTPTPKPMDPTVFLVLVVVLPIVGAIVLGLGIFFIVNFCTKNAVSPSLESKPV